MTIAFPDASRSLKTAAGVTGWLLSLFIGLGQTDALDHWTTNHFTWPNDPGLTDVAYGNHRYVAVGAVGTWGFPSGYVLTSEDGLSWTVRVSESSYPSMSALRRVIYANDLFVAVGEPACIYTSTNGINWALRWQGPTRGLYDVAYGNGVFVAVGDCYLSSSAGASTWSNIVVSVDGQTWSPCRSTTNTPGIIFSVAFGNGRFSAIGESSSYFSTDGTNWIRGYTYSSMTINFCNGLFMVPIGPGSLWVSSNALNWAHMTASPAAWFGNISYDSGLYVATGLTNQTYPYTNIVLSSADGTNWLPRNLQYAGDLTGIAFGPTRIVVVGRSPDDSVIFTSEPLAGIGIAPSFPPDLRISGLLGRTYRVEFADALSHAGTSEWQTLTTLLLTNNPTATTDPEAPQTGKRFYRSVLVP